MPYMFHRIFRYLKTQLRALNWGESHLVRRIAVSWCSGSFCGLVITRFCQRQKLLRVRVESEEIWRPLCKKNNNK